METQNTTDEEVEWQRVKAAIVRIDHTTREINQKLSHVIELGKDDDYLPGTSRHRE